MRCVLFLLMCGSAHAAVTGMPSMLPDIPGVTDGRARLLPLVQAEALRQGVPPALADAVASIETGYTENATGTSGEIGLMQVMPSTAWMLGFRGNTTDLYTAETNIHFGVAYLARAVAASGGNMCRALMKYRAGVGSEGFSPLSIQYCRRAGHVLTATGSPLAKMVADTTPAAPDLADPYMVSMNGAPHFFKPDLAAFASIVADDGVPVEKPVRGWHVGGGHGQVRVRAVMDVIRDDEGGDPHEVRISSDGND